jgi:hypothetical protein
LFTKLKEKLMGVKTASVVSYLIDGEEELKEEDLKEMEQALQRARMRRTKHES